MIQFNQPLSALNAFSSAMQTSANNIANISTKDFAAKRTNFIEQENGVKAVEQEIQNQYTQQNIDKISAEQTNTDRKAISNSITNKNQRNEQIEEEYNTLQNNNIELERELTNTIIYGKAFEANAQTIVIQDELLGSVLDMKV